MREPSISGSLLSTGGERETNAPKGCHWTRSEALTWPGRGAAGGRGKTSITWGRAAGEGDVALGREHHHHHQKQKQQQQQSMCVCVCGGGGGGGIETPQGRDGEGLSWPLSHWAAEGEGKGGGGEGRGVGLPHLGEEVCGAQAGCCEVVGAVDEEQGGVLGSVRAAGGPQPGRNWHARHLGSCSRKGKAISGEEEGEF